VILVVEDEEFVSDVACRMLGMMGHDTEVVRTGAEALAKLERGGFEAVLLDISLPDGKAEDVIAALPGGVRLVVMSGHREEDVASGGHPFMAKPFTLADLRRHFPCAS